MNEAVRADIPMHLCHEAGPLHVPVPGTLWLEVDLRANAFANLDFWDCAGRRMPLHLSLRRDAGQIIANRWTPKGWFREVVFAAPLRSGLHTLCLDFRVSIAAGTTVTLSMDGQYLGRLDARPRPDRTARLGVRRGFPGLGGIGWMTWPKGLQTLRVLPDWPKAPLHVTDRLELALHTTHDAVFCDLGDGGALVPFIALDRAPDAHGKQWCHALLPGRIWDGCKAQNVTLIVRNAVGGEIARKSLSRSDILAVLRQPQTMWLLRKDTLMRLQLLEHVHYAQLWAELPDEISAFLASEASGLTKAGFAPPSRAYSPAFPHGAVSTSGAACDMFHRAIADGYNGDPVVLLHRVIRTARMDGSHTRQLVLMLSEWFCLNDDPQKLVEAARRHGVARWDAVADPWAQIAALPMLWASADWPGCLQVLRRAKMQPPGWVVTPALGWFATALAQGAGGPDCMTLKECTGLIVALLELVAALAPAHMSQMGCHRLIRGVCDVLAATPHLPDWCAPCFAELALRAYGLNADFWAQLDACDAAMPAQLAHWNQSFDRLQKALSAGDQAKTLKAARPYLNGPFAGHDVLRRLVLPEIALCGAADRLPDFDQWVLAVSQTAAEEAALRWLAFPREPRARAALALHVDTAIHQAACAGLRAATSDIPRPLLSDAMLGLGQSLHRTLGAIASGHLPASDRLATLITQARSMALPESDYIGLVALLALAEALSRAGGSDQACGCIDAAQIKGFDPNAATRPALALALARFDALCPDPALRAKLRDAVPFDPRLASPPAEDALAKTLRAASNPFTDTLVALISCRAYLGTRVPAIRAAWGDDLAALGIPLITVVGRAADQAAGSGHRFDGQLLELDAPDDYEGLPQKTLALADWVLAQTGFGRVFKIDDDCLLDAKAFFHDPTFLNVPYYGRPLHRKPGDMDRAWHMARAKGLRGRLELDKSPEPSVYADGGTGYCLSRPALAALIAARKTVQGQALEQVSFMEDKLVGDLLALRGISVAGPNYDVAIFRKSAPSVPAIPQYHSSFLPFAQSRIKLAHLDSGGAPVAARAAIDQAWPSPMKVWPCHQAARVGWAKNALDLISPPDRLEQARDADVTVISVMRNERFMLDHFLAHYRRLGVGAFLIVDNGSDDGTLEHLLAQPDVCVFSTDTPYRQSAYGVMWQEALMAQFRLGRWSLVADADELVFWTLPDADGLVRGDLAALLRGADFESADAVRLFMLDMYPKGPISDAEFQQSPFSEAGYVDRVPLRSDWQGRGPWSNCATFTSALRHRLMEEAGAPARANLFVAQKYALLRYHPFMQLSTGLHYIAGAKVATRDLSFAHFKYHARFHAKAAAEVARGQHFNNAEEYRNYLRLQAEGRKILHDPARSVRIRDCATIRGLCGLPDDRTIAAFRRGCALHAVSSPQQQHAGSLLPYGIGPAQYVDRIRVS